jgi:hypothetical protein
MQERKRREGRQSKEKRMEALGRVSEQSEPGWSPLYNINSQKICSAKYDQKAREWCLAHRLGKQCQVLTVEVDKATTRCTQCDVAI